MLRFPCELMAPTAIQIVMHGEQVMRGNIWSVVNRLIGVQDELALLSTAVLSTGWTAVLSAGSAAILSAASMVSMAFLLRTVSATCADLLSTSCAAVLSAATVAFTAILSTGYSVASVCYTFAKRATSSQSLQTLWGYRSTGCSVLLLLRYPSRLLRT